MKSLSRTIPWLMLITTVLVCFFMNKTFQKRRSKILSDFQIDFVGELPFEVEQCWCSKSGGVVTDQGFVSENIDGAELNAFLGKFKSRGPIVDSPGLRKVNAEIFNEKLIAHGQPPMLVDHILESGGFSWGPRSGAFRCHYMLEKSRIVFQVISPVTADVPLQLR